MLGNAGNQASATRRLVKGGLCLDQHVSNPLYKEGFSR